jgi:hypothetical protein
MSRTHVQHPRPGQLWGPGREADSVREAHDRQARERGASSVEAEVKRLAKADREREAETS